VPDATDLRPGDPEVVAGYSIVSRLGQGGQGVVYLAVAPSGQRVAIKQLHFSPEDDRPRQQFTKEVAAARRVEPFCTARVLDAQLDGPEPYVISEYIDGPSLQQYIRRNGPIKHNEELEALAIGMITALASIHQADVVHRDFKPANVMLADDGPRVIDFGVARDLSQETTVTSRIFGTPAYMAPEQLHAQRVGPAADIFAWASVIVFAATGRAPFDAEHMMAVVYRITSSEPDLRGVPFGLIPVLERCLDKDPEQRPTAQQVLALLLGRPVPARDATDPAGVLAEATIRVRADWVAAPMAPNTPHSFAVPSAHSAPPAHSAPGWQTTPRTPRTPTWASQVPPRNSRRAGSEPKPRPSPGRVLTILLAVVGFLVVLAVLALIAYSAIDTLFLAPSSDPDPAESRGSATAENPATERTSSPANLDNGLVPDTFAGTWRGKLAPPGVDENWPATITLKAGARKGTLVVPGLDCSGPLTVVSYLASTSTLTLKPAIEDASIDDGCFSGKNVKLSLRPKSPSMHLSWPADKKTDGNFTGAFLPAR
jgi:serine/threonine protein kinase